MYVADTYNFCILFDSSLYIPTLKMYSLTDQLANEFEGNWFSVDILIVYICVVRLGKVRTKTKRWIAHIYSAIWRQISDVIFML